MGMCVRTSHHVYIRLLNQLPRTAIENDLKSGITVICDRYAFSGIAFSAVKPGLTYEWCKSPDISLPAPDLILFLEVHPDVARERGGYGEERYEKEALQARVREVFKKIELDTSQSSEVLSWRNIDASKSMAIVEEAIWTVVQPFSDGIYHDIQQLWT
jgi:dTMP kinase